MEVTVAKHAVLVDRWEGKSVALSRLQNDLLEHPAPVRIAQAPTGAGKSFAFRQAVLRDEARVLFVVPTRRLAQNLATEMRQALREVGLSEGRIGQSVHLWTSDETAALLAADPEVDVRALRMNQAQEPAPLGRGGMIIAVPEVISRLLTHRWHVTGQSRFSVFDLLGFEHVVFDEFHTIEARGFGLATLFAYFAAKLRDNFPVKVTFLSATPLEIRPVLERFGIPSADVDELEEQVEEHTFDSNCRVVHGDVRLRLDHWQTLTASVEEYGPEIRRQVDAGRQVVIIYNALIDLRQQRPQLERILERNGVSPERCLLINSIDDSSDEYLEPGRFAAGRKLDPLDFQVLIATASVELGVTFRADLLLMEPGFEPVNFLQRYGRAARGDHEGEVVVRIDDKSLLRQRWLAGLVRWVERNAGRRVSIRELTVELTKSVRKRFQQRIVSPEEVEVDPRLKASFGEMPGRAVFAAGLYWNVVEKHPALDKQFQGAHVAALRPSAAKTVWSLLEQVRLLTRYSLYQEAAERWCKGFRDEALKLRTIGSSINVIEEEGRSYRVRDLWLLRYTKILDRFPIQFNARGEPEVHLPRSLDDFYRVEREYIPEIVEVLFPHRKGPWPLPKDYTLVDRWCADLKDPRRFSETWEALRDAPQALHAAEKLVRLTGLVVINDDPAISVATSSVVL